MNNIYAVNRQGTGTVALVQPGVVTDKVTKATLDEQLVARCREGDECAFRELFEAHVHKVHRHLSSIFGPSEDVDDLVQLVFLNVFRSVGKFKGNSAFSTWLFRITVNVARQEMRRRGRKRRLVNKVMEETQHDVRSTRTPEHKLSNREQLHKMLSHLSPKKRETMLLYMFEGYSISEIAELLGSTTSTIGSRLQSGRKEIARMMKREHKMELAQSA